MGSIFSGNKDAKRAAEQARADAERSRQIQQVANDQQLAQLTAADTDTGASRRPSRGRRLFVSDANSGGLATKLGG
ncbi:hypothetical protein D3218_00325 [Aureimonas flava]|uniref:Uncharacterized protein n=1 Tax=Aureimonas flava TaxID=2320271 RepID=A0A3A1WQC0_9HYPH|nr:hypothetical protein [Aureimonas flava]RIY03256.1 hypothetical protein D3218_00325 [Aureimonas flava]